MNKEKISCSTVIYLEYLERKIFVYTKENIFEIKSPLYKLQSELPDNFIRISKNIIINIHFLNKFSAKANGNLEALLSNRRKSNCVKENMFLQLKKQTKKTFQITTYVLIFTTYV